MPGARVIRPLPGAEAYAPEIRISVDGKDLSAEVLADVIELRVTLQKDELGGFSLTLSNWDAGKFAFKYSEDARLDVRRRVVIEMGYAQGSPRPILVGEIQTFSPTFPESGLPTLTVTGTDMLGRLRRSKPGAGESKAYTKVTEWQIAERIARRNRLEIAPSPDKGPFHEIVMQKDMDDLTFLMERAKRIDFECYIAVDAQTRKDTLHFVKRQTGTDSRPVDVFRYAWGESLRSFTPRLTVSSQVSKVTVRGWDPRKKKKIEYTATVADLPKGGGKGRCGAEILAEKQGAKEERVVDHPVQSEEEAKELARSLLLETANQFLTGSGQVMGEPDLKPGCVVSLSALGARFDGDYQVTKVEHAFGSSGYLTSFDVERLREEKTPS